MLYSQVSGVWFLNPTKQRLCFIDLFNMLVIISVNEDVKKFFLRLFNTTVKVLPNRENVSLA